jgi:hypothetical protein
VAKVRKQGGKTETFDGQKVKKAIRHAALDAGLTEARTKKVVAEVYADVSAAFRKGEIAGTGDLRECILSDLDAIAPSVSKAWRKFDRKYKQCCA